MHILVFGGTGASGLLFIDVAIEAGHQLILYARNPSKFPQYIHDSPKTTIIKGEFTDLDALKGALKLGATVLVSFAGPSVPNTGKAVAEFYERLFPLLPHESQIRRCMVLSTASYKAPEDRSSFKWRVGISAIWAVGGSAYHEINAMSKATAAMPNEMRWTLFRVPLLTNDIARPVKAGYIGDGENDGLILSRKSLAYWVLLELQEEKWICKAPCLSN